MTNFDKMEQNFAALTEEELTDVNGGLIITAAGIILAGKVAGAVVTIGELFMEQDMLLEKHCDLNMIRKEA